MIYPQINYLKWKGTFILVIVWAFAFLLCCISLRTQRNIGPVAVSFALLVMLILLLLPRGPQSEVTSVHKVYDYLFLWRIILVILLILSAVAGSVFLLVEHIMAPKHARKMKGWVL
ncbi:uncharacterized protein LOC142331775 isoform X2 [Lycorma delicatula]|uniref:uncharacterized protein LOC142331775 isoform X2 n=1 Tax=Lycorma delicatula TaxID=130591 RepID=UPI003F51A90B